jgi:hypothetical protein
VSLPTAEELRETARRVHESALAVVSLLTAFGDTFRVLVLRTGCFRSTCSGIRSKRFA